MTLIDKFFKKIKLSVNQEKVVRNVYWAVTGKVVNIASGLFVGILVARYLGPEQFGLMNYIISYVTLFSVVAVFGLDQIEIRELASDRSNRDAVLGTAFGLRICFAVLAVLLILSTLFLFESDRFTFTMVLVYSVSLLLSSLNVIRNYFTSIVLNEYVVKTEISRTIVGAIIKVFLLINHCDLSLFIIASAFDFVLISAGYLISYRNKVGSVFLWNFKFSVAKMLIRESFPLLLSGAAIIIYQKIDSVMIRNMLSNEHVGQFAVASKIVELGIFIPMIIAQTVSPLLVRLHKQDIDKYVERRQQFLDAMVWSAVLVSLILSIGASVGINMLYGSKYMHAVPVLRIMAWKTLFAALFFGSGQLIIIEGLQRYAVLRNMMGCLICITLNYLLIPMWGIVGSAIATILTLSFSGYFSHFIIKPYRYLVLLQTKALCFGWIRGVNLIKKKLFVSLD
jgi:O-antigen/teichoic acid export membrane protein